MNVLSFMKLKFEYRFLIIYLIIGGLWILSTDWILKTLIQDIDYLSSVQTYKGGFYVLVTAAVFFVIIQQHLLKLRKAKNIAKESERLKTAFLQNISHEVRTPLNSIMGFSGLLADDMVASPEKIKDYTKIIFRNSTQLLSTINNVLEISLIESGHLQLVEERFDVNALMRELYETHQEDVQENVRIWLEVNHSDKRLEIFTDLHKLRQILENLLSNAVKFTHQGNIHFGYELKPDHIVFFVKDSGIGISQDFLNSIFDTFSQVDKGSKIPYGGTGLGLAIVKALVGMLKGDIGVKSTENIGSEFYVSLPIKPIKSMEESSYAVNVPLNLKALIVEDDPTSTMYLEEVLSEMNISVNAVKNGKKAIEFCINECPVDIIFMDLKMPVMDGIAATKLIRQKNKTVPIIVQTAFALEEDKRRAMDAGADDFITKPYSSEEIKAIIRKNLSKSK